MKRMNRTLTLAALTAATLGAVAVPASAALNTTVPVALQQRYERDRDRDNRNDYRYYRRDKDRDEWGPRKESQARRAAALRDRASDLHRQNRLSREHRDRVFEKLERIKDDVNDRGRIDEQRARANERWMDGIERDMENWSRADSRRRIR